MTSFCEITMSLQKVKGQFGGMCDLQRLQWIGIRVKGCDLLLEIKTHLKVTHVPELKSNLMHIHCDLTRWRHTQINFKPVLIFIGLAQLHFCFAHKNNYWVIIDCHTSVILHLGEDKILIYLIKTECWPNTSYFLI